MNYSYTFQFLMIVVFSSIAYLASASTHSSQNTDSDWRFYGQSQGATKYAPLDQINKNTIESLQIAWSWESPDNALVKENPKNFPLEFKGTPIKIGNTLYVSTSLGFVAAIDAKTGEQKWVFNTGTTKDGRPANLGFNHKGVSYWEEGDERRIIITTNNAYLWSLNADNGLPDKTFGNNGKVDLTKGLGQEVKRFMYSGTVPPMIVNGTVILGAVVMDVPLYAFSPKKMIDMPPGHVRGFDVKTGKQNWIFHSIPRAGEVGNETWKDDSWKVTGSTNVWSFISADPQLGYVYLPFGSASNDWYGGQRPGDNLYANSLVCLDAKTGKRVWHFQMTHHDLWDIDLPAAPNLVDITVNGKQIKAVAQLTKQGFVFVFDRITGEPVWPIEERPVPQSSVPGEQTSLTQPFPTKPAPFEVQGISEDSLIDFTPELRKEALKIISDYDYGQLYTPPTMKGTIQVPGDGGGANWPGAAFDPESGILYIPSMTHTILVQIVEPKPNTTEFRYVRGSKSNVRGPSRLPLLKPPYTRVSALNLNTGEYEWVVANGEGPRQGLIDQGIPDPGPVGQFGFSFPLVTKSLLFVTANDGHPSNSTPMLRALDKKTGETIHEFVLPMRPSGAPMTYMLAGKQYISLPVGGGKDARLVTLALP